MGEQPVISKIQKNNQNIADRLNELTLLMDSLLTDLSGQPETVLIKNIGFFRLRINFLINSYELLRSEIEESILVLSSGKATSDRHSLSLNISMQLLKNQKLCIQKSLDCLIQLRDGFSKLNEADKVSSSITDLINREKVNKYFRTEP